MAASAGPPQVALGSTVSTDDRLLRGGLQLPLADSGGDLLLLNLEGAGSLAGNGWSAQAGPAWRHALSEHLMLGGYGFAAYDRSAAGSRFVTVSPGLELLAPRWQLSANLYLPVGQRTRMTGTASWAGESGDSSYTSFSGHQQYDRMIAPVDEIGTGADLVGSLRLGGRHDLGLRLGGYRFTPRTEARNGAVAGLQAEIVPGLSAALDYGYDSVDRNRIGLTLSFRFGGAPAAATPAPDWRRRPVQHNIAAFDTANAVPVSHLTAPVSDPLPYRDNIWFFDPAGTAYDPAAGTAACSYAQPCSSLDAATTAGIAALAAGSGARDAPALYLRPGTYSLPAGSFIQLYGGQSLLGRTASYAGAATGGDRPLLLAGSILIAGADGNGGNRLENLVLRNNGSLFPAAIIAADAGRLTFAGLTVGGGGTSPADPPYLAGLNLSGATSASLSGVSIAVGNGGDTALPVATGIRLTGTAGLTISGSSISATASGDGNRGAFAILGTLAGGGSLVVQDSSLAAAASGTADAGAFDIYLDGPGGGTVSVTASRLGAILAGENGFGAANLVDASVAGNSIAIANSDLVATATGTGASAGSLALGGDATATVTASRLTASHSGSGDSQGVTQVQIQDNVQVTITGSTLHASDSSTNGRAFVNSLSAAGNSRLTVLDSVIVNEGSSATQSGSTIVTSLDDAQVTVRGSSLATTFAGGPEITEPSGAVPLWSLGRSAITVQDSAILATAGNALTVPDPLEAEDASRITITGSTLRAVQSFGNRLDTPLAAIVAADMASVTLTNTALLQGLSGPSTDGLGAIQALGSATVRLTGGVLALDNAGSPAGAAALPTVAATAYENAAIALQGVQIQLTGGSTAVSQSFGNGQVTVAD
ncbi:beta strand repeat-containing protein [Marinibaculum pumilum]|uniref:Beta strand repeat-containing protein n=1 Tax=Marinibaculum pumilum TaxID=1766165 RepID=A0ABV7KYS1_9PROT